MIIMKLQGGLGNQMFQYAAGYALAKRLGVELKLDITSAFGEKAPDRSRIVREYMLGKYNVAATLATKEEILELRGRLSNISSISARAGRFAMRQRLPLLARFYNSASRYCEPNERYQPGYFSLGNNTYIEGYFQSEKYFQDVAGETRAIFFDTALHNSGCAYLRRLMKALGTSGVVPVAVGVRRGEFVSDRRVNRVHGVCSSEYYHKAFRYFSEQLENPLFVVVSDDIEWCKKEFREKQTLFVEDAGDAYQRLALFAACRHAVIANSSYFWWGAWLNGNPDKIIIAPKKWFAADITSLDLIPRVWLVI